MEPEGSLPHSQASATCPYPGPAQSSPHTHIPSWRSNPILSTNLRLGLPSGLFPSGFPTKNLYTPLSSPIRATCPAHLIFLDFITRTILGEEYRSFRARLHYQPQLEFHVPSPKSERTISNYTQHSTAAYSNTTKGTAHCLYWGLTTFGLFLPSQFVATDTIDLGP